MAVSKEFIFDTAANTILHFRRGEKFKGQQTINLGLIAPDKRLVHGIFDYQKRFTGGHGSEEPLTLGWTKQPVLAIEGLDTNGIVKRRRTLAYRTDVEALDAELVLKVLDRLAIAKEKLKAA